jgi:hypothetical protein
MLNIIEGMILVTFHLVVQTFTHCQRSLKKLVLKTGLSIADMNFVKVPFNNFFQRIYYDKGRALIQRRIEKLQKYQSCLSCHV